MGLWFVLCSLAGALLGVMIMESNHEERNEIYRMEELIPIVGRLAEKYTGFESSFRFRKPKRIIYGTGT